ncbi:hypothetical protein GJ496_011136 [Pomphorhynchus laevis]|nr:hypothetical protein GJ496_011136 [Pomphorhynchus laevis]
MVKWLESAGVRLSIPETSSDCGINGQDIIMFDQERVLQQLTKYLTDGGQDFINEISNQLDSLFGQRALICLSPTHCVDDQCLRGSQQCSVCSILLRISVSFHERVSDILLNLSALHLTGDHSSSKCSPCLTRLAVQHLLLAYETTPSVLVDQCFKLTIIASKDTEMCDFLLTNTIRMYPNCDLVFSKLLQFWDCKGSHVASIMSCFALYANDYVPFHNLLISNLHNNALAENWRIDVISFLFRYLSTSRINCDVLPFLWSNDKNLFKAIKSVLADPITSKRCRSLLSNMSKPDRIPKETDIALASICCHITNWFPIKLCAMLKINSATPASIVSCLDAENLQHFIELIKKFQNQFSPQFILDAVHILPIENMISIINRSPQRFTILKSVSPTYFPNLIHSFTVEEALYWFNNNEHTSIVPSSMPNTSMASQYLKDNIYKLSHRSECAQPVIASLVVHILYGNEPDILLNNFISCISLLNRIVLYDTLAEQNVNLYSKCPNFMKYISAIFNDNNLSDSNITKIAAIKVEEENQANYCLLLPSLKLYWKQYSGQNKFPNCPSNCSTLFRFNYLIEKFNCCVLSCFQPTNHKDDEGSGSHVEDKISTADWRQHFDTLNRIWEQICILAESDEEYNKHPIVEQITFSPLNSVNNIVSGSIGASSSFCNEAKSFIPKSFSSYLEFFRPHPYFRDLNLKAIHKCLEVAASEILNMKSACLTRSAAICEEEIDISTGLVVLILALICKVSNRTNGQRCLLLKQPYFLKELNKYFACILNTYFSHISSPSSACDEFSQSESQKQPHDLLQYSQLSLSLDHFEVKSLFCSFLNIILASFDSDDKSEMLALFTEMFSNVITISEIEPDEPLTGLLKSASDQPRQQLSFQDGKSIINNCSLDTLIPILECSYHLKLSTANMLDDILFSDKGWQHQHSKLTNNSINEIYTRLLNLRLKDKINLYQFVDKALTEKLVVSSTAHQTQQSKKFDIDNDLKISLLYFKVLNKFIPELSDFRCFNEWSHRIGWLNTLILFVKQSPKHDELASELFSRASLKFIPAILKHFVPLIELRLSEDPDRCLDVLHRLQSGTRFLQHCCVHLKWSGNKRNALGKLIPKSRRNLESIIYRVQKAIRLNSMQSAFTCGQLKCRKITGEEISSQIAVLEEYSTVDEEVTDGIDEDNESESSDNSDCVDASGVENSFGCLQSTGFSDKENDGVNDPEDINMIADKY